MAMRSIDLSEGVILEYNDVNGNYRLSCEPSIRDGGYLMTLTIGGETYDLVVDKNKGEIVSLGAGKFCELELAKDGVTMVPVYRVEFQRPLTGVAEIEAAKAKLKGQ